MKYLGKITDSKDLVTKEYVDNRSGVSSVNGETGNVELSASDIGAITYAAQIKRWEADD